MTNASTSAGRVSELDNALRAFASSRDAALRDDLVVGQMPLVHALARRFARRGEALEDLVRAGSIELVNAVERGPRIARNSW